jgi:hypothetical protein
MRLTMARRRANADHVRMLAPKAVKAWHPKVASPWPCHLADRQEKRIPLSWDVSFRPLLLLRNPDAQSGVWATRLSYSVLRQRKPTLLLRSPGKYQLRSDERQSLPQ